jgi:hypothetical protein
MAIDAASMDYQCANPDCRVAETHKCVEGLELQSCPHFGKSPASDNVKTTARPGISLPSAELFKAREASQILKANESRVIAIIGPKEAGKTSLLASIYDLLQEGPIDRVHFWRSRTLFAFERACHDARAASQRHEPTAERTKVGQFGFYHLGLNNTSRPIDLLIADRSGEEYRRVADRPSEAADLMEVRRADTLTVLLDGARFLDPTAKHNARSDVQMILQGLIDGGVVCGQPLALVLTKFDELKRSLEVHQLQGEFETFVKHITRLFGAHFTQILSFRTAASPMTDALPRGYGVPELLRFWIDARMCEAPVALPDVDSARAIDRFHDIRPLSASQA